MADKLDSKELVTFKELLMSEVIQSEALINLLDRKGIITKQELLEEIKLVQASMIKDKGDNQWFLLGGNYVAHDQFRIFQHGSKERR